MCSSSAKARADDGELAIVPAGPEHADAVVEITREAFDGVSVDQALERLFGPANGLSWRDVKGGLVRRQLADGQQHFVALAGGRVVGYVTTRCEADTGRGRIANLAIRAGGRGRGIGRKLIQRALEHFRSRGLEVARIEALAHNQVACHLYPACGFTEVAAEVHFAMKL